MRAIEHALKKAPYSATHAEALFGILGGGRSGLSDLNIALITWLAESFGIDSRFVRSTEIETGGAKADLLVSICQALGGDIYLSAPGSRDYIEASGAFEAHGIEVVYHDRSEEHTSELQSLMRISYAVFCMQKKKQQLIAINTY